MTWSRTLVDLRPLDFRLIVAMVVQVALIGASGTLVRAQQRVGTRAYDFEAPISRIAFGSCIRQQFDVPILSRIERDRPDLMLFVGDNIYGDTEDMNELRKKYSQLAGYASFEALRRSCRTLAVWDDHDFGVNDGDASYPKRADSQQIFLDFWNEPLGSDRRRGPGIHASYRFGPEGMRTQVILLDTRFFRSPWKAGKRRMGGPYVPDGDANKTILGTEQWKWLETQLKRPADLRLIVTSFQLVASDAGQETWSNLPRERERFLRLIRDTGAARVILLSGDRHWSELSMTREFVPFPVYELTSSSLNQDHTRGTPTPNAFRVSPTTWHQPNYGWLQVEWGGATPALTLQIRDLEGQPRLERRILFAELQ